MKNVANHASSRTSEDANTGKAHIEQIVNRFNILMGLIDSSDQVVQHLHHQINDIQNVSDVRSNSKQIGEIATSSQSSMQAFILTMGDFSNNAFFSA